MKTVKSNSKKSTNNKNVVSEKINLSKITAEQLAEMNLDDVNLYELLESNVNIKQKLITVKGSKDGLYKKTAKIENESDKNFRSRIRKERNTIIEKAIDLFSDKNVKDLKNQIEVFNKFYKETYSLNDYSLASLGRLNSDKETMARINIFLTIVKKQKTVVSKNLPSTKKVSKVTLEDLKKEINPITETK